MHQLDRASDAACSRSRSQNRQNAWYLEAGTSSPQSIQVFQSLNNILLGSFGCVVGFVLVVVECVGDERTKAKAAHDETDLGQIAFAIPTDKDEAAGNYGTANVIKWIHGLFPLGLVVEQVEFFSVRCAHLVFEMLSDGIEYHVKRSGNGGRVVGCLGDAVGVSDGFFDCVAGCKQWAVQALRKGDDFFV